MKKLSLTTGALTAIAGSALLTGVAFGSDAMRTSEAGRADVEVTMAAKPADVDSDKADRDKVIEATAKVDEQTVGKNDVDKTNDQDVDNENDEDTADNDEANDNDANEQDNDKDTSDKVETSTAIEHGKMVNLVASIEHKGDKHSHRGR